MPCSGCSLIPYLYSEFAKYHFEGTPPFRGMASNKDLTLRSSRKLRIMIFLKIPMARQLLKEIKDQYMTGEYLLVAPLFAGQTTREVVLAQRQMVRFLYRKICR